MNTILKYKTLIVFLLSLSVGAQNFTDDFKKEDNGGIASQWKAVKGTGLVGEIDGVKVHKLDRYTVVTPIINGRSNNYLGEEFTVKFDAFFSEVPTPTRQYYILHLWDGTGIHGENGKHADPYFIYRHGIRASGSFGNDKKINELAVLEQTWRHIKVHYAKNTLQIFIDDQLIHHQPNLFYKPTMVSLGAKNPVGENGITNFSLIGKTEKKLDAIDGLKIIVIVDKDTKKVKNIELFETMQDAKKVSNKYPKSSFYAGVLNGKYAVRTIVIMDIEKPDWNNIMSTGNYTVEPAENSIISINTSQPYKPGGDFLPIKGARSFLTEQNVIPKDQFLASDQFGENNQFMAGDSFNLGIINTKILQNKDGMVVFKAESANNPMGFEPVQGPTGELIVPTLGEEEEEVDPFEPIDGTTVAQPIDTEIEFPNYDVERINAAILHPNGEAFFFVNDKYHIYNLSTDKLSKTGSIGVDGWDGLKKNVDAALENPINNKGYVFKGNQYFRFDFDARRVDKIGVIGIDGWQGLVGPIDAAIVHPKNKMAYFFKGSTYYRFDLRNDKLDKTGTISKDGWQGVPHNLDAAILHTNGKGYFFKGDMYYRFDFDKDEVDKTGIIGKNGWQNLFPKLDAANYIEGRHPHYFANKACYVQASDNGIKFTLRIFFGALNDSKQYLKKILGENIYYGIPEYVNASFKAPNERVYFFKGSTYFSYNLTSHQVDESGTIGKDSWQDVPTNLDAACHVSDKTYFFKDNKYYGYNYTQAKVIESGIISSRFPGVPHYIDAAIGDETYIWFFKKTTLYYFDIAQNKVTNTFAADVFTYNQDIKN